MNVTQRSIVGVFTDRNDADRAVGELIRVGCKRDQIGVLARNLLESSEAASSEGAAPAETGGVTGAVAGAGLGGLAGLGVVSGVLPVLGPIIAGGTLAVIFANATAGAVIGGAVGSLIGAGLPEEEVPYYDHEFQAGRTLVIVQADTRSGAAWEILRLHGACNLHSESQSAAAARLP